MATPLKDRYHQSVYLSAGAGKPARRECTKHSFVNNYVGCNARLPTELMMFPQMELDWKKRKKMPKKRTIDFSVVSPTSSP